MSKYTVKSFSGKFTLVAMNSPNNFFQLTRKIKLDIKFNNGLIDDDSKAALLKLINEIQDDVKKDSKLIVPYWYDNKGKVEYVEKEFDSDAEPDDQGRIIETHTFPLTSVAELEDFVSYLYASANEYKATNMYTPLLKSKVYTAPQQEQQDKPSTESSMVARACSLFKCCFS